MMKEPDKVKLIEKAKSISLLNLLDELLIEVAKDRISHRRGQNFGHFV